MCPIWMELAKLIGLVEIIGTQGLPQLGKTLGITSDAIVVMRNHQIRSHQRARWAAVVVLFTRISLGLIQEACFVGFHGAARLYLICTQCLMMPAWEREEGFLTLLLTTAVFYISSVAMKAWFTKKQIIYGSLWKKSQDMSRNLEWLLGIIST